MTICSMDGPGGRRKGVAATGAARSDGAVSSSVRGPRGGGAGPASGLLHAGGSGGIAGGSTGGGGGGAGAGARRGGALGQHGGARRRGGGSGPRGRGSGESRSGGVRSSGAQGSEVGEASGARIGALPPIPLPTLGNLPPPPPPPRMAPAAVPARGPRRRGRRSAARDLAPDDLRVVSVNVRGLSSGAMAGKRATVRRLVRRLRADKVVLQEVKMRAGQEAVASGFFPQYFCHWSLDENGGPGGVGVLVHRESVAGAPKRRGADVEGLAGRACAVDLAWADRRFTVVGVYAPASGGAAAHRDFTARLRHLMPPRQAHRETIVVGDFNCTSGHPLERASRRYHDDLAKVIHWTENVTGPQGLADVHVQLGLRWDTYTWFRARAEGAATPAARIDRCLARPALLARHPATLAARFVPGLDHKALVLTLRRRADRAAGRNPLRQVRPLWAPGSHEAERFRRGVWRDLPADGPGCTSVRVAKVIRHRAEAINLVVRRRRDGERRRLEKQLGRAERRAQRTNATEDWDRMLDLQRQLTVLEQQEVQWQSERAKHFLRVFGAVPSRRITAHFKWRRRAEGVTDDLARDLQTNMAQLYAPAAPPASADGQHERARANFLRNPRSPLSEEARAALEADVTRAEAAEAIQGLRGDSCGGADGISPALLKACQGTGTEAGVERVVAYFVNKLLRGEGHDGRLANAAITLIHKGGSRTDWRRYRPISLLSVLYKASAKVLTARLLRVMPQLVHEDQLGFVPGRDIGTAIYSLHLLDELMRIWRQSAWAVLVDFEQAYDTAFRGWAADAMAWGGLPPRFVKAAVALQSDSRASLVLNGAAGEPFPLNRGVKQGCPLSPLIFVLAVEPLAERLRAWGQEPVQLPGGPRCDRVLGIRTTGGRAETLLAFADDFNVLLQRLVGRDRNQLDPRRELAEVLRDFHRVSGLKASQTKTKLYRLGRINKRQEAKAAAQGCPWGVEPGGVRLLGAQTREQAALVWPGRLGEALRRADAASSLGLPIRGRARVANAYITSLAGYHLEMSPAADHSCVADLRRVQERYVLNARSAGQVWFRVGRIMLTAPPEEGGLGALPLDAHTAARRLRHLARALITKRVGAHGQLGGLAGILTACLEGLGAGRLGLLPFSLPETDGCHVAQLIESRRLQGKLPALESFCDAIKGLGSLRATLGPAHAPPPLAPTTDEVARQRWTGLAAEGRLTLNFDGGSRGNGSDTSTAGAGAVLAAGEGEGVETLELAGPAVCGASNNQAEFAALLGGLRAAVELGATKLRVRGDSLLVIRAMDPRDCSVLRHPALVPLWTEAQRLAAGLDITWEHVPREQNALADRLSNVAMDGHGWRGARVGGGGLAGTDGSPFASSTDFFTPVTGTTKGDLLCASLLTPGVLCAAGGGAPGAGVAGLGAPAMEGAAGPLHNDMGQDQDDSASSLHSFATGAHGRAGGAWVHDGAPGDDNTDDGIDEGGAGRPAGGGRPLLLHPVGRAMALRGFGTVGHYLCMRDPARRWDTWVSWAVALGYDRLPGVDRRGLGWVVGAFMRDLGLLGPGNEYARPDVEGQWDPWDGLALTEGFMERLRLASPGGGEANDFYRPMTATAPGWALDPGVASKAALDLASYTVREAARTTCDRAAIRQRLERKAEGWAAALGEGHSVTGEGLRRTLVALNGLPLSDALHERLWMTLADGWATQDRMYWAERDECPLLTEEGEACMGKDSAAHAFWECSRAREVWRVARGIVAWAGGAQGAPLRPSALFLLRVPEGARLGPLTWTVVAGAAVQVIWRRRQQLTKDAGADASPAQLFAQMTRIMAEELVALAAYRGGRALVRCTHPDDALLHPRDPARSTFTYTAPTWAAVEPLLP